MARRRSNRLGKRRNANAPETLLPQNGGGQRIVQLGGITAEGRMPAFQSAPETIVDSSKSSAGGAVVLLNLLAAPRISDDIFEGGCGVSRIAAPVHCA